jgi:hypothetical protein
MYFRYCPTLGMNNEFKNTQETWQIQQIISVMELLLKIKQMKWMTLIEFKGGRRVQST